MAKKAKQESQAEQSERFRKTVQDMVEAGELSPTEADERFDRAMGRVARRSVSETPQNYRKT